MEFGVTRDAFAVTYENYEKAYRENKNGDGPRTAPNIAFEPVDGSKNTYSGYMREGGFPKGSPAIYLANPSGDPSDVKLASTYRPAAKALKYSTSENSATGVMLHIGGWYKTVSGPTLASSYSCFGIVNLDNSKTSPSNQESFKVINTILDRAKTSETAPNRIDIVVEKRDKDKIPTNRTVKP